MSKARIVVLIVAAALAYVVLTSRTADGDKREPDRGQIEEIKGEREENGKSERRKARHARIFHGLDLTEDQKHEFRERLDPSIEICTKSFTLSTQLCRIPK